MADPVRCKECGGWQMDPRSARCKKCRARRFRGQGTHHPPVFDRDEIERLALSGLSYSEIARRMGCREQTVSAAMKARGYRLRPVREGSDTVQDLMATIEHLRAENAELQGRLKEQEAANG